MAMATVTESKPALITPNGGVRCWSCGRCFANVITAPYDVDCYKCKAKNKDQPLRIAPT